MRFSHWIGPRHSWETTLATAQHVERTGWDGVWFADHFMPDGEGEAVMVSNLECWTTLSALCATVPRLRVGSLVTGNTYRNPALLAKMAATADQISGGRVVLGIGAGWQENEHRAYGFDFPDPDIRRERLAEACRVIKALLTQKRTSFSGDFYTLVDAPCEPKPVQANLPILIGGQSRRLLRIVAETADEWNLWGLPEFFRTKNDVLNQICADAGRDPTTVRRSAQALLFVSTDEAVLTKLRGLAIPCPAIIGTPEHLRETLHEYAAAGVDEFIVPDFNFRSPAEGLATLDLFIEEVAPSLRAAP
jgi:F420-dependent oxidoreductase-like protein